MFIHEKFTIFQKYILGLVTPEMGVTLEKGLYPLIHLLTETDINEIERSTQAVLTRPYPHCIRIDGEQLAVVMANSMVCVILIQSTLY